MPVLGEEGKHLPYYDRQNWAYVWVVDPLDGTKEFIKRNGEFTVNIALVRDGRPIVGVIYAPVLDLLYYAEKGLGSFKLEEARKHVGSGKLSSARLPLGREENTVYVVASRSHMSSDTETYLDKVREKYGEVEVTSAGSSLKLCLVAEGQADVCPRCANDGMGHLCSGYSGAGWSQGGPGRNWGTVNLQQGKLVESVVYRKRTKFRIVKLECQRNGRICS